MRNLSSAAIAALASKYGSEPINLVEVEWVAGVSSWYADRNIAQASGRILEMGTLDDVVNVSSGTSSASINITLDDTTGDIKDIFNRCDIQLKTARVWQWFAGLNWSDKFLVCAGKVNSPITWSERERTLQFTIVSQLEDKQIGFSADEGQFEWCPADLVGKAWPMVFGTPMDYPTLKINQAIQGILATGVGIISGEEYVAQWAAYNSAITAHSQTGDAGPDVGEATAQMMFISGCAAAYEAGASKMYGTPLADTYTTKANELRQQVLDAWIAIQETYTQWYNQKALQACQEAAAAAYQQCQVAQSVNTHAIEVARGEGPTRIHIIGGEDFPQGKQLILDIGGGLFTGTFSGNIFTITARSHPDNQKSVDDSIVSIFKPACVQTQCLAPWKRIITTFKMDVPSVFEPWLLVESLSWYVNQRPQNSGGSADTGGGATSFEPLYFWAEPGTTVSMHSNYYIYNIASIVPCSITSVKAYKGSTSATPTKAPVASTRKLCNVPPSKYFITRTTWGTITADVVVLYKPLSSDSTAGWDDDIYVTATSTVGPNIVDILVYLISNYTTLSYNWTDFSAVRTKLIPFPANFPVLDNKNILTILEEIAFQARCALWIDDGIFRIKYLAEEPTANDTITLSDIDFDKGITVELDSTDNIITKYTASWHLTWADRDLTYISTKRVPGGKYDIILRHNVAKYGIKQSNKQAAYDFYIYNQPDIVYKIATFWMIRKSNSWKRVKFSTFLQKLRLETFDTILLDFGTNTYVANIPIKAVVEKAQYNSKDNTIDFECLVPVRSGEMEQYTFFWPAGLSQGTTFPTAQEIAEGWAGGNGVGKDSYGVLPVGYIPNTPGIIYIGGINIGFGPHADYGDRTPTDVGFVAKTVYVPSTSAISTTGQPTPYLTLNAIPSRQIIFDPPPGATPLQNLTSAGGTIISLDDSVIYDPDTQTSAKLRTVFKYIQDDKLVGDTELLWDNENAGVPFDFKYDSEQDIMGAGTAFLREES